MNYPLFLVQHRSVNISLPTKLRLLIIKSFKMQNKNVTKKMYHLSKQSRILTESPRSQICKIIITSWQKTNSWGLTMKWTQKGITLFHWRPGKSMKHENPAYHYQDKLYTFLQWDPRSIPSTQLKATTSLLHEKNTNMIYLDVYSSE